MKRTHKHIFLGTTITVGSFSVFYFFIPTLFSVNYDSKKIAGEAVATSTLEMASITQPVEPEFVVTHIETPDAVKAIYMTACVATMPSFRERLVRIADTTEVNSVIIDVKDFSGTIAFTATDPLLKDNAGPGCKTTDLREFIGRLHEKGIYAIAR